jgi:hypothetical protein
MDLPAIDQVFNLIVLISYTAIFFGGVISVYQLSRFLYDRYRDATLSKFSLLASFDLVLLGVVMAALAHFVVVVWRFEGGYPLLDDTPGETNLVDWFTAMAHSLMALSIVNLTVLIGSLKSSGLMCRDDDL